MGDNLCYCRYDFPHTLPTNVLNEINNKITFKIGIAKVLSSDNLPFETRRHTTLKQCCIIDNATS